MPQWGTKVLLHTALGTVLTCICTAGPPHCPSAREQAQCTVNSPGDNTEKSQKEMLAVCYWNFIILYQGDNLKDLGQIVYVSNKIKQNLEITPDYGEDMRAGGENPPGLTTSPLCHPGEFFALFTM